MTGPQILISTAMGDITLQLDSVRAPKSVASVLRYVKDSHYNGTVVYRVVKGFVIQMGSWDANVKGRPRPCRPRRWKPITVSAICAARWRWRMATT